MMVLVRLKLLNASVCIECHVSQSESRADRAPAAWGSPACGPEKLTRGHVTRSGRAVGVVLVGVGTGLCLWLACGRANSKLQYIYSIQHLGMQIIQKSQIHSACWLAASYTALAMISINLKIILQKE